MKLPLLFCLMFLFFLTIFSASAQEFGFFLPYNNVVQTAEKSPLSGRKGVVDTLKLPFFDDFSTVSVYPDTKIWMDNFVFINPTYADNPPSYGVATFDAIDNKGNFYTSAGYTNSFIADYLTSKPIYLNYPNSSDIYISFFYQPQGFGDSPEPKDSIILEFYSPVTKLWDKVWFATGDNNKAFQNVILAINQSKYLQKGFQFRFKNYASLSSNTNPSTVGNVDHWNIDYVYLNKNRYASDNVFHDIAFVAPMQSLLKNYESIPWKHYKYSTAAKTKNNLVVKYKNNDNTIRLIDSLKFVFSDVKGKSKNDTLFAGAYNVSPGQLITYNKPYTYTFNSTSTDSAIFKVKGIIITDGFDSLCNNSLTYNQKFSNYYAYDDGSSEMGYGIIGEGAQNAMLAYKFYSYQADTLQAIQMYFNQSLNSANQKYFNPTVWKNDPVTGQPGKVLYRKTVVKPVFESELNRFHNYLLDTTLIVADTFYIGWTQTTSDLLNVGLDVNRTANDKMYYNTNGNWKNSVVKGALMIRPVFGKAVTITSSSQIISEETKVSVYPNPANELIYITFPYVFSKKVNAGIYDMMGKQLILISDFKPTGSINIGSLPDGIYILRLDGLSKPLIKKIMVQH